LQPAPAGKEIIAGKGDELDTLAVIGQQEFLYLATADALFLEGDANLAVRGGRRF